MSNVALIYASDDPLSANNQVGISVPVALSSSTRKSFSICYDGGGALNYVVQVCNLPGQLDQYTAKVFDTALRDDTYNSPMWTTVETGSITNTDPGVECVFYPEPASVYGRVLLAYSGTSGQTNVTVLSQVGED